MMRTLLLLALSVSLAAEQGGYISGVVRDRSGTAITGAEVRVQNEQTGATQKMSVDPAGLYTSSELAPGTYKVTVKNNGFRTSTRPAVAVNGGHNSRADFTLELLPLQQEITVTAEQSHDDPMVSGVTASRDAPSGSMPANGRDVHALFSLMPGATITPASLSSGGQFTVSGQRPNANSFRVDGVSGNVGIGIISVPGAFPGGSLPAMTTIGGTEALASNEDTRTVELRSADFAAQYGDRPGAQIDIETRSGANDFHASAFGYIRPQALDSTDWFARGAASGLPPASVNGWGGSAGGPVWRGHTYFFAAYERSDVHDSALQLIPVASEAARQQAGPYQAILDAFPAPSGRALSATEAVGYSPLQKNASANNVSARLDQTIGSHVQLFGRFSYVPSVSTSIELGTAYSAFNWTSVTGGFNIAAGKFTDEGRFNFSQVRASAVHGPSDTPVLASIINSLGGAFDSQFGILAGQNIETGPFWQITQLSVGGEGQTVAGQAGVNGQRQMTGTDTFAWHGAKQDIHAGADYINLRPNYEVFTSSLALASAGINSLLAGIPLGVTDSFFSGPQDSSQHWSCFVQDTFHLSSGLDLLLGTRWEFTPSPYIGFANDSPFYPYIAAWHGIGSALVPVASFASAGGSRWPMRYRQFAPRIGFAYHLHHPDIVIRAGAGIFYDTQMGSLISNENPLSVWQYVSPSANPPTDLTYPPATVPPTLYLPRVLEWRATLEKSYSEGSALSLSYVGSEGRRLLRNEATTNAATGILQSLAFTSNGKSDYEALLAQYKANITSHLYGLVSYTWSHSIDNGSSDTEPFLVQPGAVNTNDRGSSSFDVRQVFSASLGYKLSHGFTPFLRDWTLSSTLTARTGFPFDVTTVDRSIGLGFDNSGRADLVPGVPVWIGNQLNPAAFAFPTSGQNGTLGRNVLTGDGLFQMDLSVRRQFRVFGPVSMDLSMSAFNALNHPAFSSPVSYLGSALFGQSTSTANLMLGSGSPTTGLTPLYQAGGPRTVELGVRFSF
jgi:hypothetical protein